MKVDSVMKPVPASPIAPVTRIPMPEMSVPPEVIIMMTGLMNLFRVTGLRSGIYVNLVRYACVTNALRTFCVINSSSVQDEYAVRVFKLIKITAGGGCTIKGMGNYGLNRVNIVIVINVRRLIII